MLNQVVLATKRACPAYAKTLGLGCYSMHNVFFLLWVKSQNLHVAHTHPVLEVQMQGLLISSPVILCSEAVTTERTVES